MCHQQYALWDGDPYIDVLPLQLSSFPREKVTRRHPIYMLMLRIALHIAMSDTNKLLNHVTNGHTVHCRYVVFLNDVIPTLLTFR